MCKLLHLSDGENVAKFLQDCEVYLDECEETLIYRKRRTRESMQQTCVIYYSCLAYRAVLGTHTALHEAEQYYERRFPNLHSRGFYSFVALELMNEPVTIDLHYTNMRALIRQAMLARAAR